MRLALSYTARSLSLPITHFQYYSAAAFSNPFGCGIVSVLRHRFPFRLSSCRACSRNDQITVVLQIAISSQALASIDLSKLSIEELHIYLGWTSAKESEFMSALSQARGQFQSSVGQFKSRLRNALTARSVQAKAATPGAQAEAIRKHASSGASEL